jgi:hypothetical protein
MKFALALMLASCCLLADRSTASAQQNPKDMSGMPLPVADVPAGTVSVRVIRGDFSHDIPNQPVDFTVDGTTRTVKTGADGRALFSGIRSGADVKIVTVVDGERLESQPLTIAGSGIRMILVATDPNAAAEARRLAASPPEKGTVTFGPQSRVIAEVAEDALNIFYVLDVVNPAKTPVDIGGPLLIDLPAEARGAGVMDGSTPQAKANGSRITVLGPFAPGTTSVQVGYELPFSGGSVRLEQKWPADMPKISLLTQRIGGLDVQSAQVATRTDVAGDNGQPLLMLEGPALAKGQTLSIDFSGLPHRPLWPRYLALTLALVIVAWGLGVAVQKPSPVAARTAEAQARAERDRLLQALASLERRHASARVPHETYAAERQDLMTALERVYASLDTHAA